MNYINFIDNEIIEEDYFKMMYILNTFGLWVSKTYYNGILGKIEFDGIFKPIKFIFTEDKITKSHRVTFVGISVWAESNDENCYRVLLELNNKYDLGI